MFILPRSFLTFTFGAVFTAFTKDWKAEISVQLPTQILNDYCFNIITIQIKNLSLVRVRSIQMKFKHFYALARQKEIRGFYIAFTSDNVGALPFAQVHG